MGVTRRVSEFLIKAPLLDCCLIRSIWFFLHFAHVLGGMGEPVEAPVGFYWSGKWMGWVKDGVLRLAERGEVGKPSFDDWILVPCRKCKREDSGGEEGICAQRR